MKTFMNLLTIITVMVALANFLVITHSLMSNQVAAAAQTPRENLQRLAFVGSVTSVNLESGTFMLATNKGARQIKITPATIFQTVGGASLSLSNLSISDYVGLLGELSSETDEITAIQVIKAAQGPSGKRQAVYGIIVGNNAIGRSGALLAVSHPTNGSKREVSLTYRTKITTRGAVSASITDISISNRIVAVGTVDERGVIEADRVHIVPVTVNNP